MTAGDPQVVLRGVAAEFRTGGGTVLEVLRGVDLEVRAGESVAIMGPSGSGKSTLLHVIAGLLPPTRGSILVAGRDVTSLRPDELSRFRNRELGMVFQDHQLLPQCTALENVLVPTLVDPDAGRRAAAPGRAAALLQRVGLADRRDHRPGQLSGGECQRVAVVRALIQRPSVVLADEPTGSLDADHAAALGALLRDVVSEESAALIVVTHSGALAESMQTVRSLENGVVVPQGVAS